MLKFKQMAYTFTTDGDYVIFSETTRTDGSYIRKLAKTSKAVEWSYDDSTPVTISFVVDNLDYRNVRIGNIIIDGETMTTTSGFETAIGTVFPSLAGGGATEVTVYQRKTILTDAQIKALPSTPVELVPAPGANKVIILSCATLKSSIATAYTGVNASDASLGVHYSTGSGWEDRCSELIQNNTNVSPSFTQLTELLGNTGNKCLILETYRNVQFLNAFGSPTFYSLPKPLYVPGATNNGLYLLADNTGDFTGGDAANTLEITVFYSIVDL